MVVVTIGNTSYEVRRTLFELWQKNSLKKMADRNMDKVYIVDGMERSGKSTFAIQQMGALDPKAFTSTEEFVKRICFTPDEFFNAVRHLRNSVIIFDESFRGFSSRSALSKTNKKLVQALMEMGQNNNIVFIVLPSFFQLDIYVGMQRSHGLFHVYISKKDNRRLWSGWNMRDKNTMYQVGIKRGWKYFVPTIFRGTFSRTFPGGPEFEKAYLDKKAKALREMDKGESNMSKREELLRLRLDLFYAFAYSRLGSPGKVKKYMEERGVMICDREIARGRDKFGHLFTEPGTAVPAKQASQGNIVALKALERTTDI